MTKTPPIPKKPSTSRMAYADRLGGEIALQVPNNMSEDTLQALNFKVAPDFHRQFKTAAVVHGKSMRDVLEESFRLWVEKHKAG